MTLKRLSITLAAAILMTVFFLSIAMAGDPKWREKQRAWFEEIGVVPGDVITKDNCQKIKGFVPEKIFKWIEKGWWEMKIGEVMYDLSPDDTWLEYGPKHNVGKYKIVEENLVEAKTGQAPLTVNGQPFPLLDENIADDPNGAAKLMYNRFCSWRRGKVSWDRFSLEWVSLEHGFERAINASGRIMMYWSRTKAEAIPNPSRHRLTELMYVAEPFDLRGTCQLTLERLDGKPSDVYVYVPAIRRVKKMSGANRSDPYMGSDFAIDDGSGYMGQNSSMKWRFIKETTGLHVMQDWNAKHSEKYVQMPNGSWEAGKNTPRMKKGWEVKGWARNVIEPVTAIWVPRKFYVIEAIPKDSYYNYGKTVYWVDKGTRWMLYKMIYDRAMEYWKTTINIPICCEWDNGKKGHIRFDEMLGIDEKTHHACTVSFSGLSHGKLSWATLMPPSVDARLFSPARLPTLTK